MWNSIFISRPAENLQLLPVSQRYQLVQDFLQSLKAPFLIIGLDRLFPTSQIKAIRFSDLRDLGSQLGDAIFHGILHGAKAIRAGPGVSTTTFFSRGRFILGAGLALLP
jgi:hypothetical protein